ncbi:unnamed protein product [Urochloa decumbens]|uniref:BTB domain-containing protein n=1 Tax=Urochloa decumbens TaxID=240449 RepID=A0ABC9FTR1_9POAL
MSCTAAKKDDGVRITGGSSVRWEAVLGPHDLIKTSSRFTLGAWPWELAVLRLYESTCVRLTCLAPLDPRVERVVSVSVSIANLIHDPPTETSRPRVDIDLSKTHGILWGSAGVGPARLSIEIKFISFRTARNVESNSIEECKHCLTVLSKRSKTESRRNVQVAAPTSPWLLDQMSTGWRLEAQSEGLARMLGEGILSDILVNAGGGGSIRAHRAVLAARSPVFASMFSHDLRETRESTLDIPDMTVGACRAFMGYLYGSLREEEFLAHRSELLRAGDKYDVAELRRACEESMANDVDVENALERLQMAHLYGLWMLKRNCVKLLQDFREMFELREDFHEFMRTADPDLVAEVNENFTGE